MQYTQLVLVAPQWLEEFDEQTGTLYLRAVMDGSPACELLVDPIPGTDPVQFSYRCRETTCTGQCELNRQQVPGGVRYYCQCPDGASLRSATTTTTKAGKGAKTKKKKARRSK